LTQNIEKVKNWWDFDKYGIFTNGDQDRIVYELVKDEDLMSKITLVDYEIFNTRPYHFKKINDHFLVHFAGNGKAKAIHKFKLDFGFNDNSLVPIKYEKIANKIKESLFK